MTRNRPLLLSICLCAVSLVVPTPVRADLAFDVNLNTASFSSSSSYAIGFDLIDGDGLLNTTITLSGFSFSGGAPIGSPSLSGGAIGSLATTLVLSDTSFLNELYQGFSPGTSLSFHAVIDTTASPDSVPDSFAFYLYRDGNVVTTSDPNGVNSVLSADLTTSTTLNNINTSSSTDPSVAFDAPSVTAAVPEPSTFLIAMMTTLLALPRIIKKCREEGKGDAGERHH
jgi:hypothetical protein